MSVFKVVPIRYDHGWRLCDIHRAEQWAVVRFRGRMEILLRCATKAKAEEQLVPCQRAYEGISMYQLGKRMPKQVIICDKEA